MTDTVEIVEVSPRDGLQNESRPVSTADKVRLVEALIAAGVRRMEATSFVHPDKVPQMADAEDVMAAVPRRRRRLLHRPGAQRARRRARGSGGRATS